MNKSELTNWLQEEHRKWEALLSQIGPSHLDQPGVNGVWSMKDMVAHLTGWNRWHVSRLGAASRGEPVPPAPWPADLKTEDEINAWIYESNHGLSVDAVLDDSHQVFRELFAIVESLPEDVQIEQLQQRGQVFNLVWLGEKRFQPGEFFDHFRDDHEPDVRAWMGRQEKR